MKRSFISAAVVGLCALVPATAYAQGKYPDHPIALVVARSPGGSSDTLARVLTGGGELAKILGQPVVVENRPGASGYIAWRAIAAGKPNGYTLLVGENALAMSTALRPNEPLDPRKAFDPIALIATAPMAVNVNVKLPIKTMQQLIKYSKTHQINYGSSGVGSVSGMGFAAMAAMTGVRAQQIPYKGGGALRAALVGGFVQASVSSINGTLQMIREGGSRALAVTSSKPVKALPGVPTLASLGYKSDVKIGFWWGIFVTAGTPKPIKKKLESAFKQLLKDPKIIKRLEAVRDTPKFAPADYLGSLLNRETVNWSRFVKANGLAIKN